MALFWKISIYKLSEMRTNRLLFSKIGHNFNEPRLNWTNIGLYDRKLTPIVTFMVIPKTVLYRPHTIFNVSRSSLRSDSMYRHVRYGVDPLFWPSESCQQLSHTYPIQNLTFSGVPHAQTASIDMNKRYLTPYFDPQGHTNNFFIHTLYKIWRFQEFPTLRQPV